MYGDQRYNLEKNIGKHEIETKFLLLQKPQMIELTVMVMIKVVRMVILT